MRNLVLFGGSIGVIVLVCAVALTWERASVRRMGASVPDDGAPGTSDDAIVGLQLRLRSDPEDLVTRARLVRALLHEDRRNEALVEVVWIWERVLEADEPGGETLLGTTLPDMQHLAARHPIARVVFRRLLERLQPQLDRGTAGITRWCGWWSLAGLLRLHERQVAWVRASVDEQGRLHRLPPRLLMEVCRRMWAQGYAAEAGALPADPADLARAIVACVRPHRDGCEPTPRPDDSGCLAGDGITEEQAAENLAVLHHTVLSAGRDAEAAAVADVIAATFCRPREMLAAVRRSIEHGAVAPHHRQWLENVLASDETAHHAAARALLSRLAPSRE